MDTVLKILEPGIEFVRDHGINQLTYIFCYTKNFEELNNRVKRLGEEKERLDDQRGKAKRKGHIVEDRVEEWFGEVSKFETLVENYRNNAGHKKTAGLYYLFPYYRHKLGRQAKKMAPEALRLKDECPKVDEVSHAKEVTSFDLTSSNHGYIEFDSRKSIVEDIMTKLKDPNMKIIGLHGSQGIGKSTLIKKIANKVKDEKLFDRVAEIDVTDNPNPLKIQEEIAHVLDLPLAGESENVRADYLRRWLKVENVSILIILDNLHERLDLNRLGIPVDDDYDLRKKNELSKPSEKGNSSRKQGPNEKVIKKENFLGDYKGCKVLLSSRDKKVFPHDVGSTFNLEEIDENESLMLFEKVAGRGNKMSIPKEEIQTHCAGLPMTIFTFAEAFKKWSESESEPTLDKFKKQGLVEWQKSSEIPNKGKYDPPQSKELNFIYLLCAQMGHLPLVNDLVKYSFGLGILEGVSSLSEAREKINESMQELKNLSLVSYRNPNIYFNMSRMVRDDALSNALVEHNFFALRDGTLDYWPYLEKCISISICNSDITDGFPQVINCPQLKFLQIETNDPFLEIPESFFSSMKNLLVLILTGFHLSRLPSSIEDLLNLRMLCLERCTLDCNLSVLRKFKKLRILSFSGSQLQNLPAELRYLGKLRLLDISDCFELKIIPPNLISNLTCLEELYVRKSLINMLVESEESKAQNSFLSELQNLYQLKVVDISIPCVSYLPNHLFFDRLKDYKIEIGEFEMFSVGEFRMLNKYKDLKVLALQLKDDTDIHSHKGIKLLFKTTQSLLLGKVGVQNVVNELNIDGFQDLKHLSIINNNDIKYVNSTDLANCVSIFPNLESLCLCNMMKLKMICHGPITLESFATLKTIKVEMCYQLENLFSFYAIKISAITGTSEIFECNSDMKKFLASLEMIEVCECGSLKEILQIPMNCGKVEFLKLRTLTLQSLPSFTCFCTKVERSRWPHLTEAQTTNMHHTEICTEEDDHSDNMPPLFDELVEVPNLENLDLSSLNIHKIWNDQHLSSLCFQNLIKLVVKDCDKLTHLCSLSMASSLKKLKNLIISGCRKMENIFEIEGISANKVCVFPKLEEINLSNMKRLTNVWQTKVGVDSFSSLISVSIEECNKLDKIFPSHMEGWFESLINLKVSNCESVKEIFEVSDSEEIDVSGGIDTNLQVILLKDLPKLKELWSKDPHGILNFKKLRTIDVIKCDELRNLFPASMAKDVSKLERMSMLQCERMVEIVSSKDASEANNDPLQFPELTFVRLYKLPNMKQFYNGRHLIKCPKLKELSVGECMKLKTFLQETSETTSDEQFVFSAEAVFPKLEYMEIDFNEAQKLLPKYQMHRLKELSLVSVERVDLLNQFPYRIPNLEKLKCTHSYYEELVPKGNVARQKGLGIVLQLKELVFLNSGIKDLGFERGQVLQRLELLRIEDCDKLSNLCPPFVSLTYLTFLEVKSCWGLRNLMASSTAQTMVQLKTLKVINCREVEEIVSKEGCEEGKVMKIVFSKLISIELVELKNMRSFCSYKECKFEFPSLEIVIVRECPKMEKFSEEGPIAPKLKDVFGVEGDQNAKWHWEDHLNATIQKVFNDKVSFAYTENLWLLGHRTTDKFIMEQLWQASRLVQQNSFGYLKSLTLRGFDTVVDVIPSHLLSCFHNLEELDVSSCSNAEVIFNINDKNKVMTKASGIFRLKSLSLQRLPKLEHIWNKDPEGIIGLQMLKEMRVEDCQHIESLFPASVAQDLIRLEVLEVVNCKELTEIFRKDAKVGDGTTQHSSFPRLTTLTLEELPALKYSIHCSKQQESTSNLGQGDIQELCLGSRSIPNSYFCLLESLILDGCKVLSDVLLPFNLLTCLTNLETLEVRNCDSVKIIFDVKCTRQDREVASMGPTLPFSLKKLTLSNLSNLKNVWNEDPRGILTLHHLHEFNVEECKGLTSVFPLSVAKDVVELGNLVVEDVLLPFNLLHLLTNLETLEVRNCDSVKAIFDVKCTAQGRDVSSMGQTLSFSLKKLTVSKLPNLKNVWNEDPRGILTLHHLQEFNVEECKGLTSVFPLSVAKDVVELGNLVVEDVLLPFNLLHLLTNLETLEVRNCDSVKAIFDVKCTAQGRDVSSMGQTLSFSLKKLTVSKLPNLKNVWNEDPRGILTLHHLQEFNVEECKGLTSVFPLSVAKDVVELGNLVVEDVLLPFNLLHLLTNLETLEVRNCDSVKAIFDVKCTAQGRDVSSMGQTLSFSLKKLTVSKLPNLKNVWNEDPQVILSMHHLQEVCVEECEGLTSVFPASKDKYDVKLENLVVKGCKGLMTIFAEDNTNPSLEVSFPCPCVRSLKLQDLPNFKYFLYCDIFTDLESHTENQVRTEMLQCMSVGENGMKMIVRGEFERNLLHSLKALTLCSGSDVFRCKIVEEVANIEKLVVNDCSFKKMFCCERPDNVLQHLKVLQLESLGELVSIGLENSWTDSFVRNLETFEVIRCSSLKNLVSRVSFTNLACLRVESCNGLSYLFTSSTAKSLGQLKRMEIKWCESIEEIVCKEESDEDEIIFPKLTCLNLEGLWKLKRFYRGSLSFPSLEEFSVKYCEEMITICAGTVDAVKLSQVTIDYRVIPLETDLNSTLRKTFLEKISELDEVDLKDRRGVQEIWCGSLHLHFPDLCFSKLAILIVEDCQFLSDAVIPFPLLPLLPKLKTLEVRNCDYVKTIFDVKSTTKDRLVTLPLEKLTLSNLSNLENVWNEDPRGILSMQSLEEVFVDRCKCLKSVFPASVAKDLVELKDLRVEDCEGLMAIVAEESDENQEIVLERLRVLDLKRLEKLGCFNAGNFTLSFPSLKEVHVIECSSMKTFGAFNKIDHSIKWYYSEYGRPRKESDLNSALHRTSEEQAPDASTAIISDSDTDGDTSTAIISDSDTDGQHGDD